MKTSSAGRTRGPARATCADGAQASRPQAALGNPPYNKLACIAIDDAGLSFGKKTVRLPNRTHKITLIPGDGIGPEVTAATVDILEAACTPLGCTFDWHRYDAGADAFAKTGEYIPKALYESIKQNRVALKGPVTTPVGGGFSSINVTLRKKFDLFANFRPVKTLPGLKTNYPISTSSSSARTLKTCTPALS